MGNKIFYGIIALIVVVFGVVVYFIMSGEDERMAELEDTNPYDKEVSELTGPTRDSLEDENYQYNITYDEVKDKFDNKEDFVLYVWSPTCMFCQQETPKIIDSLSKVQENKEVEFVQLNADEYQEGYGNEYFEIEGTPSLLYIEGGEVVSQMSGAQQDSDYYTEFIETGDVSEYEGEVTE